MSAWKLCLRTLYLGGGDMRSVRIGSEGDRRQLLALGLATQVRRKGQWWYVITDRGRDVATGRVVRVMRPKGERHLGALWVPTWTAALPNV